MVSISICCEQTVNELKLQPLNPTQHWSCWRPWGYPTPVQGFQEVDLPWSAYGLVPGRLSYLSLLRDPSAQDPRKLTCLGIGSLRGCHTSTCSRIHHSKGPRKWTCLNLLRDPILGRLTCLDVPRDSISRRLSCFSLLGDLHPDPGTHGSQVAIVLGRIIFKKTHP